MENKTVKQQEKKVPSEHTHNPANHNHGHKHEEVKPAVDSSKPVETVKENKEAKVEKVKKTEAVARGVSVRASKRHCMYICSFIKGKKIDAAIADLEQVIKIKKIVPFKGEIP